MPEAMVQPKKTKQRSPAYPFINLSVAIERAKEFYKHERRNAAPVTVAVKHWDYKEKSSGGIQTIAALKSFGLMQDSGSSEERKVQLSILGLGIIMDERVVSPERDALIKKAALNPKIHALLWNEYKNDLPSDESLRHKLRVNHLFNDNVVGDFIKEYKDTIAFAQLPESDTLRPEDGGNDESGGAAYVPKPGDYVQWESQGALQCKDPVRVLRVSTDGAFAFVEGTNTGLPVKQLIPASAPSTTPPPPQIARATLPPTTTMQEDVYSLPEGRIVVQWPTTLSAESVQEIKDYLKLLERKITRSVAQPAEEKKTL